MFMDSEHVYWCVMQPPLMSPQLKLLVVLVEHMDSRLTETIAHIALLPSSVIYYILACLHETLQLINALFSSRDGGTKQFQYEGIAFGWKAIEEMYAQGMFKKNSRACTYGTQIEGGPYTERLVDQVECTSC